MNVGTKILYEGRHLSSPMEGGESRKTTIRTKARLLTRSIFYKGHCKMLVMANT